MAGRIIVLNGASSAGKTSIARQLQGLFEEPYLRVGVNDFLGLAPMKVHLSEDREVARRVYSGLTTAFHRTLPLLADAGNLIVTDVLGSPRLSDEFATALADYKFLFVGVQCPLDVVEQREVERGDRRPGLARSHFDAVHEGKHYDLEVDTSSNDPRACAQLIKERADAMEW